ncbi:uracil-DNA glycosylase [Hoeflea sp. WL0058]|uniref:Type-4 uracil-DNA glycosylase n=1 Tax=Flavimaribacter sediminis TaxID=2865987 RepID=A0AAE2ZRB2_9HYPH|nr:uracil-DNA glycosylase [Flavimaribacter sediminis]MBW8639496.1 uracil-DNA glycosylase [Flavimaribacter sediminis]
MTTSNEKAAQAGPEANLATLLRFYAESGVDALVGGEPVDRFAESEKPEPAPAPARALPKKSPPPARSDQRGSQSPPPAAPAAAAIPDQAAVNNARETAAKAASIDALREALLDFNGCNLRSGARNTVFADGNPAADIMFVGEAPGRDEDRQGLPFVGRAGQLLDRMLAAIDLDRESVYITNMIPWRPPGNRTPTPFEIELCRPFIERHIALANPKIIVFLGNVSTKSMLNTTRGILSIRGSWSRYKPGDTLDIPALPTLHPAYLLRNPAHKRLSWMDFLALKKRADEIASQPDES